jgi:hypothetical protein
MSSKCTQCGNDGANAVSICDAGEQPISVWLHRNCEAAFLKRLDARKAEQKARAEAAA